MLKKIDNAIMTIFFVLISLGTLALAISIALIPAIGQFMVLVIIGVNYFEDRKNYNPPKYTQYPGLIIIGTLGIWVLQFFIQELSAPYILPLISGGQ
jgi:hypothetical protein